MISPFVTTILFALTVVIGAVSICAKLHEKGIRPLGALKKTPLIGPCALAFWAAPIYHYGSTKGGRGNTNGVSRLATYPGAGVSEPEQPVLPIVSTNTDRTITAADSVRGFIQARIGTNEEYDFTPPGDATIVSDWMAFGAATDWIYVAFTNWVLQVGTNDVNRMCVYSFGKVEPFIREANGNVSTNNWFAPFIASLGTVPQANWDWLAETGRPSQVWYAITPEN